MSYLSSNTPYKRNKNRDNSRKTKFHIGKSSKKKFDFLRDDWGDPAIEKSEPLLNPVFSKDFIYEHGKPRPNKLKEKVTEFMRDRVKLLNSLWEKYDVPWSQRSVVEGIEEVSGHRNWIQQYKEVSKETLRLFGQRPTIRGLIDQREDILRELLSLKKMELTISSKQQLLGKIQIYRTCTLYIIEHIQGWLDPERGRDVFMFNGQDYFIKMITDFCSLAKCHKPILSLFKQFRYRISPLALPQDQGVLSTNKKIENMVFKSLGRKFFSPHHHRHISKHPDEPIIIQMEGKNITEETLQETPREEEQNKENQNMPPKSSFFITEETETSETSSKPVSLMDSTEPRTQENVLEGEEEEEGEENGPKRPKAIDVEEMSIYSEDFEEEEEEETHYDELEFTNPEDILHHNKVQRKLKQLRKLKRQNARKPSQLNIDRIKNLESIISSMDGEKDSEEDEEENKPKKPNNNEESDDEDEEKFDSIQDAKRPNLLVFQKYSDIFSKRHRKYQNPLLQLRHDDLLSQIENGAQLEKKRRWKKMLKKNKALRQTNQILNNIHRNRMKRKRDEEKRRRQRHMNTYMDELDMEIAWEQQSMDLESGGRKKRKKKRRAKAVGGGRARSRIGMGMGGTDREGQGSRLRLTKRKKPVRSRVSQRKLKMSERKRVLKFRRPKFQDELERLQKAEMLIVKHFKFMKMKEEYERQKKLELKMYGGYQHRKKRYGVNGNRLPSIYDNRPNQLKFRHV